MKRQLLLRDRQQALTAFRQLWRDLEPELGQPHIVKVEPMTRSDQQNRLFHALCSDVASQLEYAGKRRTMEEWKLLFISGHSVATKQGAELVPGLEGEFLNLRESSAKMSVSRMGSLIDYVTAYAAMNNVKLKASERWMNSKN